MDKEIGFRHIIKTFVPGLFTTIILIILFDLILCLSFNYSLLSSIKSNNALAISILIPISIFNGIIINTFCFVFLIPKIIELHKNLNIFGPNTPNFNDFIQFKDSTNESMSRCIYNYVYKVDSPITYSNFEKHFDIASFLLHFNEISSLNYIKTGYWYYLEFQLNSIVTIILGFVVFGLNLFFRFDNKVLPILIKILILLIVFAMSILICLLLFKAIIKNLERDQKKEFSYQLGAFKLWKLKNKL